MLMRGTEREGKTSGHNGKERRHNLGPISTLPICPAASPAASSADRSAHATLSPGHHFAFPGSHLLVHSLLLLLLQHSPALLYFFMLYFGNLGVKFHCMSYDSAAASADTDNVDAFSLAFSSSELKVLLLLRKRVFVSQ